uniref:NADH dehydrogenase subunit 4 n=1 Tax=Tomocerus caputiviolaceus TaxID=2763923 RepID=UPI0021D52312|nr:NADH dehydrogenase subunit 4 [Tomocerus caputiviolaceus]UXC95415.1 NADH dehydrogenase subunit 4 [Tomocerus caputiviolaceus]
MFFLLFPMFLLMNKKIYQFGFCYVYLLMFFFYMFELFSGMSFKFVNSLFGFDSLSLSLLLLSIWVSILMVLSSMMVFNSNNSSNFFLFMISILLLSLLFSFMSMNLMSFYFFFEFSLIPTLLLIMGWGYQPERIQAGVYFLFYTLTASLPLLLGLIYVYNCYCSLVYLFFDYMILENVLAYFFIFCMTMAFLVKMPLFMFHLWLPKAHVEAPVSGSMILAGVLLKLGGFGLYRVMNLISFTLFKVSSYMVGLCLMSMVYVGLMCCRLNDLKALVAYSSVAHMGLVICGIYTYYIWGFIGCLSMMIAHGVSSSGLFCMVNMFYERSHSRSIYLNKGVILVSSVFSMFFFLLCASNISAPPSINLLSEIFLMASVMGLDFFMIIIFPLGSFLGTVFTIFMFSYSQHGKNFFLVVGASNSFFVEYLVLFMHVVPLNMVILVSEFFFIS